MKKFLILAIILVLVFSLCGCSNLTDNNFPVTMSEAYHKQTSEANLKLVNSKINDVAAFNRETALIAYTLDRDVPFKVTFLYQDYSKDSVTALPVIHCNARLVNEKEYREMFQAQITMEVFNILDKYQVSDDGDIVGVIVHWERTGFFGGKSYYSVCDFDGDGAWDYRVRDTSEYDSMGFLSRTRNSPDTDNPVREFDEYNIVELSAGTFQSGKQMYDMNLSGKGTFKDIEKLFKADAKPA